MDLGLIGKTAVVTGGSRGLGKAAAFALAAEGCAVAIISREAGPRDEVIRTCRDGGGKMVGAGADVRDRASLERAFEEVRSLVGDPDILVYNSGGAADSFFDEATDDEFLESFQTLVMGLTWCVREVAPAMKDRKWGRIVSLGSICSREPHTAPFPLVLHNIGRPAQTGLSKTLANELGPHGVTVNMIGTGTFLSDGTSGQRAFAKQAALGLSADDVKSYRLRDVPAGRFGTPEEFGALCAFVCSTYAGYINGQTIFIDGGRTRGIP